MSIAETEAKRTSTPRQEPLMNRVKDLFKVTEFIMLMLVIALMVIGSLINPRLIAMSNLKVMTRDIAILAIAAIGEGFTIITAGIDLSIGSLVGLGGVFAAFFMMNWGLPIWLSILLVLGVSILIGVFHGVYVTKLHMHGFLITLVTMGLARGLILVITGAFPITGLPEDYNYLGQGYLFDIIPIPVIICVVIAILSHYLLRFTFIGRQIYATGGNINAARFSGVKVGVRITLCYIISAACGVIVGMIQAGRMALGHPGTGEGYELLAIAACILGGYSFMGGEGSVPGAIVGAMLIGVLQNGMIILNIDPYWHKIVIYLVLLAAITFDYGRRRRSRT